MRWREAGSRLLILEGDPVAVLPQLAERIGAEAVLWNRDVEPYARERDRQVAKRLQADGRQVVVDWDQLLIAPELLKTEVAIPTGCMAHSCGTGALRCSPGNPSALMLLSGLLDLDLEHVPSGDPGHAARVPWFSRRRSLPLPSR